MTIPNTYNNLVTAIQEELEDSGAEFINNIPSAIRRAEDRINRDVDGLYNTYVTTVTCTSAVREVSKPEGHKLTFTLNALTGTTISPLVKRTQDYIDDYWPDIVSVGTPKYYADLDKTTIIVAPTPNTNQKLVFNYSKTNTYLSSSNQTNNIIDYYQDLLFKATLVEQCKFARMPEAMQMYEQDYLILLANISEETRRERTDNTSPRNRVQIDENRKDKGQ